MKFIDEVEIEVRSGDGGSGSVHFMRAKYAPKMGPDGGDGARGGHVYFESTHDMQSLLDFKYQPRYAAENGHAGSGQDCNGRSGKDITIRVPVGTVIRDTENGEILADLVGTGERILLLTGGRGGLGNMNFATASRQAPDFAQPGRPGQARKLHLELKLLADVGLVGFPNAGKSTLISRWSAARPKIADYPFTTLVPNLGVVRAKGRDFVLADIPGLIEGASEGRGLGHRFLKHCERTRLLVILVDLDPTTGRRLRDEFEILERELHAFSDELGNKPQIVALNKIDAFGVDDKFLRERGYDELKRLLASQGRPPPFFVSAVTGQGLEALKDAIEGALGDLGPRTEVATSAPAHVALGDQGLF